MSNRDEGAWTAQQAADYLQMKVKTVRALALSGAIPAWKLGKAWRFDENTLREHVATRTKENVKPWPSLRGAVRNSGKSSLNTKASLLKGLLKQPTNKRQKTSKPYLELISSNNSNKPNERDRSTHGMKPPTNSPKKTEA